MLTDLALASCWVSSVSLVWRGIIFVCKCVCVCMCFCPDIMCLSSLCLAGLVCPGWPSNTASMALIWRGTAPNMPQQPEKCVHVCVCEYECMFEFVCMCAWPQGKPPFFYSLPFSWVPRPISPSTHTHTHTTEEKLQKPSSGAESILSLNLTV